MIESIQAELVLAEFSDLGETPPVATVELTVADRAELGRHEAVIGRGLQTFVEVGNALAAIRDGALYRGTHATFLDYCRDRWELGRSHVYRLMDAAQVAENLGIVSPMGELTEDVSERALRPIAHLKPDQQRAVYLDAKAVSLGNAPTATQLEEAASRVVYTSMAVLENMVWEWTYKHARETARDELDVLQFLDTGETTRADKQRKDMMKWLREMGCEWRIGDLQQAVKRVHTQRRQAKLQASGRAVYVEPKPEKLASGANRHDHVLGNLVTVPPSDGNFQGALKDATADELREALGRIPIEGNKTKREKIEARIRKLEHDDLAIVEPNLDDLEQEADDLAAMAIEAAPATMAFMEPRVAIEPDEPATEPTADELEAMALVAVETAGEDAERAERDAHRAPGEAVPTSILTREWVVFVLTGYDPINVDFATALKAATLDDLREALASLTTEEKHWKARHKALVTRFDELVAPDPRIACARAGIDAINTSRIWVRDNYLELTGMEVNTLAFWRDTALMLDRLESLIGILTRKDVTK